MKLNYMKVGDYYLPKVYIPRGKSNAKGIGRYGRARLQYLKEHKKGLYTSLMIKNELENHLQSVDKKAKQRERILMDKMIKEEQIDEQLKEHDQMYWVGIMNNIKHTAIDIVLNEIVYK